MGRRIQQDDFRKGIAERYSDAKFEKKPLILVEGVDDIPFYDRLCKMLSKSATIIPVDTLKEHTNRSCEDIIRAVEKITDHTTQKEECKQLLLGIIDGDTRWFRNEVPQNECIYVFKFYSFENYLINKSNIQHLIKEYTSISEDFLDDSLLEWFEQGENEELKRAYYVSLEALKTACDRTYVDSSVAQYSRNIEEYLRNDTSYQKVIAKKEDLDRFAQEQQICFCDRDLKRIIKGHWYLRIYAQIFKDKFESLPDLCKEKTIKQCMYCEIEEYQKCLYKTVKNIQINDIENSLKKNYDYQEMYDLQQRILILS